MDQRDSASSSKFNVHVFASVLLLLFPVLAVAVKSWTSSLHVLLFFTSTYWLLRYRGNDRMPLSMLEKSLIGVLVALFAWYLLAEYVNGWQVKSHWPWIEFRYLMIIPVLLMLRHTADAHEWLVRGAIMGSFVAMGLTLYQSFHLKILAIGAYHHLFLGPAAAMMGLLILYSQPLKWESLTWKILALLGFLCAMTALVLSTARSGLLATAVVLLLFPLITGRLSIAKSALIVVMISAVFVMLYVVFTPIKMEINHTISGVQDHLKQRSMSQEEFYGQGLNNITIRFEMWRAAWMISSENKLYGVGRAGFSREVRKMIAEGQVHPQLASDVQPHNAYLYQLVTRGYPGFLIFLLLLLTPLAIFIKHWHKNNPASMLGISLVLFFSIVSLTQSSVFLRGHYLSFFLVCLAVLVSSCLHTAARDDRARVEGI